MPKDAGESTSWIDSFWIDTSWIDTRYTSYFQAHPNLHDHSKEVLQVFSFGFFNCRVGQNLISVRLLARCLAHGNALYDGRNCPA